MQAANQLAVTECERCVSSLVRVCVCVCVRVYLPARGVACSLFSPPPFGSLTQTNHALITISGKPLLPNKCQLDDNLQATLEEKRMFGSQAGLIMERVIIVLDASHRDQERGGRHKSGRTVGCWGTEVKEKKKNRKRNKKRK